MGVPSAAPFKERADIGRRLRARALLYFFSQNDSTSLVLHQAASCQDPNKVCFPQRQAFPR